MLWASACSNEDALGADTTKPATGTAAAAPMRLSSIENEARRLLVKEHDERQAVADMEQKASVVMADYLFDPSSAQFRSLERGRDGAICGKVNAKNRLGAYVGFKDFVVPKDGKSVFVSEHNDRLGSALSGTFVMAFLEACATKDEQDAQAAVMPSTPSAPYSDWTSSEADRKLATDSETESSDPFAE